MNQELARKLKYNGRPVKVVCNQVIDFDELDFGVLVPEPRITAPMYVCPARQKPKCECGAEAIGVKKYMSGHSDYCPVHEDKTPTI